MFPVAGHGLLVILLLLQFPGKVGVGAAMRRSDLELFAEGGDRVGVIVHLPGVSITCPSGLRTRTWFTSRRSVADA